MRLMPVAIVLLLSTRSTPAQNEASTPQTLPPANIVALHEYESCTFDDGLQIVKIDSLPAGVQQRTINTAQGPKTIEMLDGRRIMLAYGVGGDFFANVKPELLADNAWATEKQSLLDELAAMIASEHDTMPNTILPQIMHGLEVHGLDRTALKGGTLGFYLLFDNEHHVATSVYFLNQEQLSRRFQTIEQYRALRTRFLTTYTGCIAQNRSLHAPAAKDAR
jgi:hypothetical protein